MKRRGTVLLMALVAILGSAACGSDNKVGDESLLDFKEQANSRLGETTTTTAAPTTTTAKAAATATTRPGTKAAGGSVATATTAAQATTTAPSSRTAAAPTQTIREIYIYGDDAEVAIDPQIQTAYTGSIIRWINKDTVDRAVRADSGQFASPTIKPGASWDYVAGTVGNFTYGDDTRPYVKGELRVAKKP